jgi:hypothetical protein
MGFKFPAAACYLLNLTCGEYALYRYPILGAGEIKINNTIGSRHSGISK